MIIYLYSISDHSHVEDAYSTETQRLYICGSFRPVDEPFLARTEHRSNVDVCQWGTNRIFSRGRGQPPNRAQHTNAGIELSSSNYNAGFKYGSILK